MISTIHAKKKNKQQKTNTEKKQPPDLGGEI